MKRTIPIELTLLIPIGLTLLIVLAGCTSVRTVDFTGQLEMSHEITAKDGSRSYGADLVRRQDSMFWTDQTGRSRALARSEIRGVRPILGHAKVRPWSESLEEINRRALTRRARVVLSDETDYPAHRLRVARDTTTWFDPSTRQMYRVPTRSMATVRFRDGRRGSLRGLATGAATGVLGGLLIGLGSGDEAGWVLIGSAVLGVVAAPVGAVLGSGSNLIYRFAGAELEDGVIPRRHVAAGTAPEMPPVVSLSPEDSLNDAVTGPENSTRQAVRRWSVAALGAGAVGTAAQGLEDAMNTSGFGRNIICTHICSGELEYPNSLGSMGWLVDVHREIRSRSKIGFLVSKTEGETSGHDGGHFLNIRRTVMTYAPVFSLQVLPVVRVGLGPAFHRIATQNTSGLDSGIQHQARLGLVGDLAVSFPAHTRFFLDLRAQYRLVGSVDIGPFEGQGFDSESFFPASPVGFSHGFFGAGFGMRF